VGATARVGAGAKRRLARLSLEAGLIAAHFHSIVDGTRVLNVAEWTNADAHRRAVTEPAARLRRITQQFPGVTGIAVQRFTPYLGTTSTDR
jgi:Antibiotic biosynthesis monooxygenase